MKLGIVMTLLWCLAQVRACSCTEFLTPLVVAHILRSLFACAMRLVLSSPSSHYHVRPVTIIAP